MVKKAHFGHRGGKAGVSAGFLAALLFVVAEPPALWAQIVREEVVSVNFAGNRAFADAELRRAIFTRASSCPFLLAVTCTLGIDWGRDRAYLSRRTLDADVQNLRIFYQANGYRSVDIHPEVVPGDDGTAAVTFRIREGAPYWVGAINLTGDSVPPELGLHDALPFGVGDPLSPLLLLETADTLMRRLRNEGYARAEVFDGFRRERGSDTASVDYRVELGPRTYFGPIKVTGIELLDRGVILNRLPFREGQLYSERLIREAQRNLYELDIVVRARVMPDTAVFESDSVMPIVVEVVEGDARLVWAGGGFSSADCLNLEGRWTSRNFFGGGRILRAQARVSNFLASSLQSTFLCRQAGTGDYSRVNWLGRMDFNQPSFPSRQTNLSIGVFAERHSLKNIFVRDARGLEMGLVRVLGGNSFTNLRFRPQLNRLDAAEATLCATFLACTPDDIEVLSATRWLSPAALSVNRDVTDDPFNPTRGFRALVDLEWADVVTGSDYSYVRVLADASLYRRMDRHTVLALRVRAGSINPGGFVGELSMAEPGVPEIVPSEKRFYGGGANSVRGFAQSNLGPRSLSIAVEELLRRRGGSGEPACRPSAVLDLTCDGSPLAGSGLYQVRPIGGLAAFEATAELRFRLSGDWLGGAAFVDIGQVWPEKMTLDDLEVAPGIGLRYELPFGPVRLDVAYSFRDRDPLPVVTSQIRPYVADRDSASDRIDIGSRDAAPELIDWVVSEDLALLGPPVLFGDETGFSLRRFQIHLSIGQAF